MPTTRRRRGTPKTALNSDDEHALRWRLHVLSLAIDGLREQESAINHEDLDALAWHVDAMRELAPYYGEDAT